MTPLKHCCGKTQPEFGPQRCGGGGGGGVGRVVVGGGGGRVVGGGGGGGLRMAQHTSLSTRHS